MNRFVQGQAAFDEVREFKLLKRISLALDGERMLREHFGISQYRIDGDELTCRCPLPWGLHKHGDRTGKFSYNLKLNVWNCWVCGGGDALAFIKAMEPELSDGEALALAREYVREMTEEELSKLIDNAFQDVDERQERTLHVSDIFAAEVNRWSEYVHPYWAARGINLETVHAFRLGYDSASNRVVVPHIYNGIVVGHSRRSIDGSEPKWQHSEGLPKRDTLFNADLARKYPNVVVVEAPLSAVYLWQCGIPNVVATFGASVTDEQVYLLRAWDDVVMWFDADQAGAHGTKEVLDRLVGLTNTWVVNSTQGDPNEVADGVLRDPYDVWASVYERGLIPGYLWTGGA